MRWLFVGIVALNILYFGWAVGSRDASPGEGSNPAVVDMSVREFPATLELLDDRNNAPVVEVAVVPPPASSLPVVSGCPAVGPLPDAATGEKIRSALSGRGLEASVVSLDKGGQSVFWVYLPPQGNRQQALRKLRELQAKGIDSFVVSTGPDENAISLGSFSSRDSARGVEARLRSSGYEVMIREQVRSIRQNWVVLRDPQAQGVLEAVPRNVQHAVRLERVPCSGKR